MKSFSRSLFEFRPALPAGRRCRPQRQPTILILEKLGERILPATTLTWNGSQSALWSIGQNWTPPQGVAVRAPANGDTLIFNGANNVGSTDDVAGLKVQAMTVNLGYTSTINLTQTLEVDGALTLGDGVISGAGALTLPMAGSNFSWTKGSLGAHFVIGSAAVSTQTVTISGAGAKSLLGGVQNSLDNYAQVNWTGGDISFDQGHINNEATGVFDIGADVSLTTGGTNHGSFDNSGTVKKSAGGATGSTFATDFNNLGSLLLQNGILTFKSGVYAQGGGLTSLQGGNLTVDTTYRVDGGIFTGVGTFTGNLNNTGGFATSTVEPGLGGVGKLTVVGTYTQYNNSRAYLQVDVSATGTCGLLSVVAGAGLNGTATITNGAIYINRASGYDPAGGTTLNFFNAANLLGDFTNITWFNPYWTNGGNRFEWIPTKAGNSYNLIATAS